MIECRDAEADSRFRRLEPLLPAGKGGRTAQRHDRLYGIQRGRSRPAVPMSRKEPAEVDVNRRIEVGVLVDTLIEKDFGIKATPEEFREARTVGALAAAMERHLAGREGAGS